MWRARSVQQIGYYELTYKSRAGICRCWANRVTGHQWVGAPASWQLEAVFGLLAVARVRDGSAIMERPKRCILRITHWCTCNRPCAMAELCLPAIIKETIVWWCYDDVFMPEVTIPSSVLLHITSSPIPDRQQANNVPNQHSTANPWPAKAA